MVALVSALTAAGLAVRLVITRGLWLDEATSVMEARMSFGRMLDALRTTDVHPPGYFTMLWGWVRIFGDGPLSVRMPTILLGAALVPVLYLVGRDLYGRRTGIVAAVFGVVGPQLVWYSQEARMYMPFMLLVTLSVWAQLRALRSGSTRAWLAHGALCAAMLWTQYFTIFVILTQQVATLLVLFNRHRRRSRETCQDVDDKSPRGRPDTISGCSTRRQAAGVSRGAAAAGPSSGRPRA
jgi:uncharacterized membrane protein